MYPTSRSELVNANLNGVQHGYDYDNIGNRAAAVEDSSGVASRKEYTANALNQYTAIGDFEPTYDDAGNQTLVKTSTGIWAVDYDAEKRPVLFTNAESTTVVECTYDYMGRRATKKVTVNGAVTLHHRYLYRGYLQIACCDLTRSNHPCLWLITWDPTQAVATRPLAIQKDGTWYTYGWDLTKNICEVFGQHGYIRTNYTYSPFGQATATGDVTQPIQWSSEYHDTELALVYYNYRHYNPTDGRWLGRDRISQINLYSSTDNKPIWFNDYLGNEEYITDVTNCIYLMVVKIKPRFIDEDDVSWTEESKQEFKIKTKKVIEETFNNNPYKLVSDNKCCLCHHGMRMSVEIRYVDSLWWDWNIKVYAGKAKNRRASSAVGFKAYGKLYADSNEVKKKYVQVSNQKFIEVEQIAIVHEFGHALGLEHPGVGKEYVDLINDKFILKKITRNESLEYEYAGFDINGNKVDGLRDLMGIAMGLRAFYFERWKKNINSYKKDCQYVIK